MKILISIILAYIITGLAKAFKDLYCSPLERPHWAVNPTTGKFVLIASTWAAIRVVDNIMIARGNVVRGLSFGLMGVVFQLAIIAGIIWTVITVLGYLFGLL